MLAASAHLTVYDMRKQMITKVVEVARILGIIPGYLMMSETDLEKHQDFDSKIAALREHLQYLDGLTEFPPPLSPLHTFETSPQTFETMQKIKCQKSQDMQAHLTVYDMRKQMADKAIEVAGILWTTPGILMMSGTDLEKCQNLDSEIAALHEHLQFLDGLLCKKYKKDLSKNSNSWRTTPLPPGHPLSRLRNEMHLRHKDPQWRHRLRMRWMRCVPLDYKTSIATVVDSEEEEEEESHSGVVEEEEEDKEEAGASKKDPLNQTSPQICMECNGKRKRSETSQPAP